MKNDMIHREWERGWTMEKMPARKQHLTFSLHLKRYGLIPRSLYVHPLVNNQEDWEIAQRTSRRFAECSRDPGTRTRQVLSTKPTWVQPVAPTCGNAWSIPRGNTESDDCKVQMSAKEETWHLAGMINWCIPLRTIQWQMVVGPLFQCCIHRLKLLQQVWYTLSSIAIRSLLSAMHTNSATTSCSCRILSSCCANACYLNT